MRAWSFILCCAPLIFSGCFSISNRSAISASANVAVPVSDQAFSQALAHFSLALILETEEGQVSVQALEHFQKALQADPANHDLASRVAVIALHRRDFDTAVKALEASYQVDKTSYTRTVDLATAYQVANRFDDAIALYTRALEIDQTPTAVYIALAGLFFRIDQDHKALSTLSFGYTRAEEPQILSVYLYDQARLFLTKGDIHRAIDCFEQIEKWQAARQPQLSLLLAELYVAVQEDDEAIRVLRKAMALPDPQPEVYTSLAFILMKHKPDEAVELLKTARKRFDGNPSILFSIGCVFSDTGKYEDAIPYFEESSRKAEEAATVDVPVKFTEAFYLYLGGAYERTGQIQKAEIVFEDCIKRLPDSHRVLNYLAYMWADDGRNLDQALKYSVRSLISEPDNGAYLDTLAWVYFKMHRYDLSLETMKRAMAQFTDDPEMLLHFGDIQAALGNTAEAITFWEKSYRLMPEEKNRATEQLILHGVNLESLPQALPNK